MSNLVINSAKVYSLARSLGVVAATGTSVLVVLGGLDASTQQGVLQGVNQFIGGAENMIGGGAKVIYIIGPIIVTGLIHLGVSAQSLTSILQKLTTTYKDLAQIDGKIVVPPEVAKSVPSHQVVSPDDHTS